MRIHACVAWFDEDPRWLAATVASLAKIADHVVAVDGAYFLYPQGRASSGGEQAETVVSVCASLGLACTLHIPDGVWMGNEVEKRNAYVRLAAGFGTVGEDWLLVIDSDEVVSFASPLTRRDLEETSLHVAEIGYWSTDEIRNWAGRSRRFYRLLDGLKYGPTHFTVQGVDPDMNTTIFVNGRGESYGEPLEAALDLSSQVRVEHKHSQRATVRNVAALEYARMRESTDAEQWVA